VGQRAAAQPAGDLAAAQVVHAIVGVGRTAPGAGGGVQADKSADGGYAAMSDKRPDPVPGQRGRDMGECYMRDLTPYPDDPVPGPSCASQWF
jgi:hypothetical protein